MRNCRAIKDQSCFFCLLLNCVSMGYDKLLFHERYGNENLKATVPSTDYDKSKTTGEFGIF